MSEAEFYSSGSPATAKRYRYVFGTTSYDALNRLKSADFSSWSGSSWTSTLAHDLTGINYDLAGNITALQRYRETGSLIDNLTYSNATTSNRLNSVSDAVGATTETWDAETGSFTYDANGNLKTAPAPYSITAVTYDHQNLPISLTSAGTTKTYRYNDAGQRITKQVGTGNTEVYLLDGATSLGVFTVNSSGSPTSWFFNVLAGDKVVGRQPHTGNRRYYHTDLLGSTRAVVEGASVVESYDFEPWGLVMPGRTLAGPTKEGFTSKERDAESGLDYFGARYYMAALGRWTAVDPLAEKHPEWSPYNYVLNNPLVLIDPDGRQVRADLGTLNPFGPHGDYRITAQGQVEGQTEKHQAQFQGAMLGLSVLPIGMAVEGVVSTLGDLLTGNFSIAGAGLNFLPGPNLKKVGNVIDAAGDASRTTTRIGGDAAQPPLQGTVYRVPGSGTPSGKPYIGRHNKADPAKTRRSNDGRDRRQAEVVDRYDARNRAEGRGKEQAQIDAHGGIRNLDNKRNEIRKES